MHGARGGAGPGRLNPAYQHGGRTKKAYEIRRLISALARESRATTCLLSNTDHDD